MKRLLARTLKSWFQQFYTLPASFAFPASLKSPLADTASQTTFVHSLTSQLLEYIDSMPDSTRNVVEVLGPRELLAHFEESEVPLSIPKSCVPSSPDSLLQACEDILRFSVRTGHPRYLNQLSAHVQPVGMAADWMCTVLNTNVHTFEVSPVLTLIEEAVLRKLASCISDEWASCHDGLFVPGASIANMYGMLMARHRVQKSCRTKGARNGANLVAFVSKEAHYSFKKSAIVMGLGTENVIAVGTSSSAGEMDPVALENEILRALSENSVPFFVAATSGTTVTGAFDPIDKIAKVCKKYNIWLHVDGAWGGPVLLSPQHRYLMRGVELADSMSWDAHKFMGLPIQCSAFLLKHPGLLQECLGMNASYLFHPDRETANYDIGDKTIQCGRRGDALKLWLMWRFIGDEGWAIRVARAAALSQYAVKRVTMDDRFRMAFPCSFYNVCFWYLPKELRDYEDMSQLPEDLWSQLHTTAPKIKKILLASGKAMVQFQPHNGLPNCFKLVFPSPGVTTQDDLDLILDEIASIGDSLSQSGTDGMEDVKLIFKSDLFSLNMIR